MSRRTLQEWLGYIRTVHFRSMDMTLDRVQVVLERLVPAPAFRVVAVAGTNGKGSCAAMLGAVLEACGCRTGVYTSPHLVRFNERIRVAGEPVDDEALCRAFEAIEAVRGDVPLTYFEFATLAAVEVFQRRGVALGVMEVGMGGRLDAVNALPIEASLITNVALDHVQWLGRDRESIGREKAPVMRGGRPAVFNHPDIPASVRDYAASVGARLMVRGRDYRGEPEGDGWRWLGPRGECWSLPRPPVPGAVQVDNAAGVLALLTSMDGIDLDAAAAARGLAATRVAGRCEIVARDPMVMVDVAHNPSAIDILVEQLEANPVAGATTAVFGMLKDKEPALVVRALDHLVDTWRIAGIEDERGQTADELKDKIAALLDKPVYCHADVSEAYDAARADSGSDDRILVFGSFLIAGDILRRMKRTC